MRDTDYDHSSTKDVFKPNTERKRPWLYNMDFEAYKFSIDTIAKTGRHVRLPCNTMSRAYYLWHKFHSSNREVDESFGDEVICISVLDLASKLEETVKSPVGMAHFILLRFRSPNNVDIKEAKYFLETKIAIYEQKIMEIINFETFFINPFAILIKFAKRLNFSKRRTSFAWDYLKRSYETPACIKYPTNVVVLSVIAIAENKFYRDRLILDVDDHRMLLKFRCNREDLQDACIEILKNAYSFSNDSLLRYLLRSRNARA